jgi:aspartyl-tRNA(Asn)/glutamyl-tRNA(Gln) amidotransferase subunit C
MTNEEIEKLSKLCRIACSEEEKEILRQNLSKVLGYIDQLKQIETNGIPPCNTVLKDLFSVLREDEVADTLSRETFLANAPQHVGGMVRVPPVIQFD